MDSLPRRLSALQRTDGAGRTLLPSDSVSSISSHDTLLVWMFEHIRRENQDSLTKEDLRKLLEVDIDNEQLDEAFENLDTDGDGRVSLDEFLSGFARFLREAPTTPGHDRHPDFALLRASGGHGEPAVRLRAGGKKRGGSARRSLVVEECYESADNGADQVNGGPAVRPSEDFAQSLVTLSSHNRHSIASLWRNLADTNPELLADLEDFVGEVAHEVEGAQRALENQRRATKQEALELDEEMESRLNAANANLQLQTALTEVKTKVKLEQRLGDKERELTAVKQKLQELNSRLESVCNFALQLEGEVQAGHRAHTELEEQFEMLSQEKVELRGQLEAREAVLMKKHEEMERLHRQASQKVDSSHIEEKQVEIQEIKKEYEREISELKETIMVYEMNQSGPSDDEMSLLSGQTPDLLTAMSTRHRHTSRHSLLDEIVKQEGIESPILRGEPLMPGTGEETARPLWRANSLPDLCRSRQYLEPMVGPSMHFRATPPVSRKEWSAHPQSQHQPLTHESEVPQDRLDREPTVTQDNLEKKADHVTQPASHVTSEEDHMAMLDSPFSRSRSATVSGGGRPKLRPRRPKKNTSDRLSDQSRVMSRDNLTASTDSGLSSENQVTPSAAPSVVVSQEEGRGRVEGDGQVVVPMTADVTPQLPSVVVSKEEGRGRVEGDGDGQVESVTAAVAPSVVVSKEEGRGRGVLVSDGQVEPVTAAVAPSVVVSKEEERGRESLASKGQVTAAVAPQPPSVVVSKEEGRGRTERAPKDDNYSKKCQPLQFIENLATQPDYVFKILVVGNSYVGKSSFLMRLCTNAFSARYASTIGVDFYSKALKVDDRIISLQLWDTAGQERFQSVTKAYYRGAQGVILMYDIGQEESFIAVKSWINSIQENVDQMPTGLMLIGNKQDLDEQNDREVATETGETFAKIYSAQFMETSAKTGFNVGKCLMDLVRTIKVYYEQGGMNRTERGIQISNKPKGSSCCGR